MTVTDPEPGMPLTIAREDHGTRPVLTVDGDLDLATAPQLASLGLALVAAGAPDVIVDAQGLTFCDSSGLSVFVQIANRVGQRQGRLAIVGPTPIVRRVLEMSGLVDAFVVADSVPAAITALDGTT
jgi:anti-sigma B factor antagonist